MKYEKNWKEVRRMFGIGVIGCGRISQVRHIPEYAAHKDAKLVGYYNPSKARAEQMAAKAAMETLFPQKM